MKSNKGISLISLTIYLIVLTILVGITAGFTRYFFRNSNEAETSVEISKQYTRVLEYLVEDVNSGVIDYIDIKSNGGEGVDNNILYLYLNDNTVHQYYWDSNSKKIYYVVYDKFDTDFSKHQFMLCGEVKKCNFELDENNDKYLKVETKVGDSEYNNIFKYK